MIAYRDRGGVEVLPDRNNFTLRGSAGIGKADTGLHPGAEFAFFCGPAEKIRLFPLFFIVKTHYLRDRIAADERYPGSFER